jgi:hypothetical protein
LAGRAPELDEPRVGKLEPHARLTLLPMASSIDTDGYKGVVETIGVLFPGLCRTPKLHFESPAR